MASAFQMTKKILAYAITAMLEVLPSRGTDASQVPQLGTHSSSGKTITVEPRYSPAAWARVRPTFMGC